jgi:hypothetical protein
MIPPPDCSSYQGNRIDSGRRADKKVTRHLLFGLPLKFCNEGRHTAPTPSGFAEVIGDYPQYFIGSLPFSLPDEFPTPRNLSASFSGSSDWRARGQCRKTLCPSAAAGTGN